MGFQNPITFLLEKLNELWLAILHPFVLLFNAIKTGFVAAINFPVEILRRLWLAISHMFEHLINWLHVIMKSVETGFVAAINFPVEILRRLWLAISHMFEHLINWLHVIMKSVATGFVEAINFPAEKIKALWRVTMVDAWDPFVRWIRRVFGPEIWSDRFNHWLKSVQKLALDDTWYPFLIWFDRVFPPETRAERLRHWLQVGLPFVAVAVVFGVIIYCCCRFPSFVTGVVGGIKAACWWCWRAVTKICDCCWGGGVKAAKMMKAPGRSMIMIPRRLFEADPKGYFVNLRASP